jgi:uncharacterized protein YacL
MNLYYLIYCRAYYWYKTSGKKSRETLRISALGLISGLIALNISSVLFIVSLINKHTIVKPWIPVLIFAFIFFLHAFNINLSKSDELILKFDNCDIKNKRKITFIFYSYFFVTIGILIGVLIFTAYYKHLYGNYDL